MSSRRPFAPRVLGPAIVAYGLIGVAIGVATWIPTGVYQSILGIHLLLEVFDSLIGGAAWVGVHLLVTLGGIGLIGSRAWSVHLLLLLLTGLALYNGLLLAAMGALTVINRGGHEMARAGSEAPTIALWAIVESIPTVCLILFNRRRREDVERYDTARILKTDPDG